MRSKDQYTAAFLENDPREPNRRPQYDIAYINWWQNARRDGGFRLTQKGCLHCIDRLQLEYYEIPIPDIDPSPKFLLDLDRFIKTPYYIRNIKKQSRSILLFDKKTHFALTMYNGDFQKFINAHKL
jgi:hypothetical protein